MTVIAPPAPTETPTSTGDDVGRPSHGYCTRCYPTPNPGDVALCGHKKGSGTHQCPRDFSCGCIPCVVCLEVVWHPCPTCGT